MKLDISNFLMKVSIYKPEISLFEFNFPCRLVYISSKYDPGNIQYFNFLIITIIWKPIEVRIVVFGCSVVQAWRCRLLSTIAHFIGSFVHLLARMFPASTALHWVVRALTCSHVPYEYGTSLGRSCTCLLACSLRVRHFIGSFVHLLARMFPTSTAFHLGVRALTCSHVPCEYGTWLRRSFTYLLACSLRVHFRASSFVMHAHSGAFI